MAKAPSSRSDKGVIARTLSILSSRRTPERLDAVNISKLKQRDDGYGDADKKAIIEKIRQAPNPDKPPSMAVNDYFDQHFYAHTSNRIENLRILRMDPTMSRASEVYPPTIISPNDLNQKKYNITIDETSLNKEKQADLVDFFSTRFERMFNLSTTMVRDIREALFVSGAKVWLVIPQSSFEAEVQRGIKPGRSISRESLEMIETRENRKSLFGISNQEKEPAAVLEDLCSSTESLAYNDRYADTPEQQSRMSSNQFKSHWKTFAESVISQEKLSLSDNPFPLRTKRLKTQAARDRMNRTAKTMGKGPAGTNFSQNEKEEVIQFIHTGKDYAGEPIVMDIPKEAVIPLTVPGSPNDHIGYFIILDDYGHPASLENPEFQSPAYNPNYLYGSSTSAATASFYSAFGFNDTNARAKQTQANAVMSTMYERVISSYLEGKAKKSGFNDIKLGKNPAVYRYLLSRYLTGKQAKILFVPADMVVYMAFETDAAGNGISKLENVKYTLSLKIALTVAQSLSSLDSSINRRHITYNAGNKNEGNILQQLNIIREQDIKKNLFTFSSDPSQITNYIMSKAYSFDVTGKDNFEFKLENQPRDRAQNPINTEFIEMLNNEAITGINMPPAAMNALKEGEYAASVVTTNIIFANQIMTLQKPVKESYSRLFQTYIRYSESSIKKIKEVILGREITGSDLTDGSIDINKSQNSDEEDRITNIIESVQLHLSPPNMANNKAQTEALTEISNQCDALALGAYPDDIMGSDSKLHESLAMFRGFLKRSMFLRRAQEEGVNEFGGVSFDAMSIHDAAAARQEVINFTAMINEQNKALMGEDKDAQSDQYGGGGMGFDGGAGGGDDFGGFNDPSAGAPPAPGGDLPPEEGAEPQEGQPVPDDQNPEDSQM